MAEKLSRQQKRLIGRESIKAPQYNLCKEGHMSRYVRRHMNETKSNVVNQRKRTLGRNVQYQIIPIFEKRKKQIYLIGKKTIKHIVPTAHMIKVQKLILTSIKL